MRAKTRPSQTSATGGQTRHGRALRNRFCHLGRTRVPSYPRTPCAGRLFRAQSRGRSRADAAASHPGACARSVVGCGCLGLNSNVRGADTGRRTRSIHNRNCCIKVGELEFQCRFREPSGGNFNLTTGDTATAPSGNTPNRSAHRLVPPAKSARGHFRYWNPTRTSSDNVAVTLGVRMTPGMR
jgi:hypothetical protein